MTKTSAKKKDGGSALFVFGLDENGKPRGARFPQGLKDNVVAAVVDMKLNAVHDHSAEFTALGMKLPIGRIYASGKSFIPNIRRDLYDKLKAAQERPSEPIKDGVYVNIVGGNLNSTDTAESPTHTATANRPWSWADIKAHDLIIAQSSHIEGWWEALVLERNADILTLRWRDYPAEGTVQRHVDTVALINPTLE